MFRLGLLKVSAPDFITWNLRSDSQDRNAASLAVVQPVDQMQVPGTAAPGANRQVSREMRFRSSSKRCRLFVPDMNPLNPLISSKGVGDAIERIAGNTINPLNSRFR